MELPSELVPRTKGRVIDLVEAAGLDVSDWRNYARGQENPGANPKYCYEWALGETDKLVVCNLWTKNMLNIDGEIEQHLVLTDTPERIEPDPTRRARRERMANLLLMAHRSALPVRVIVLDGKRQEDSPTAKPKVSYRALDRLPWAVVESDPEKKRFVLRRGASPATFADQFDLHNAPPEGKAGRKSVSGTVIERSRDVRLYVLRRAGGRCEYCGERGFVLPDGRWYLETHHIVPLSQDGSDAVLNVVALCANHHREAHFGSKSEAMKVQLLEIAERASNKMFETDA